MKSFAKHPQLKMTFVLLPVLLVAVAAFAQPPSEKQRQKQPQTINTEHLLDGTKMRYFYQNGSGIQIEFYDGKLKYDWIAGPAKGRGNKDLPYRSRKIGGQMYLINWLEESHPDFVTLVFNFENNVMYSSGLLRFGSEKQRVVFDGGIIEHLQLSTK